MKSGFQKHSWEGDAHRPPYNTRTLGARLQIWNPHKKWLGMPLYTVCADFICLDQVLLLVYIALNVCALK